MIEPVRVPATMSRTIARTPGRDQSRGPADQASGVSPARAQPVDESGTNWGRWLWLAGGSGWPRPQPGAGPVASAAGLPQMFRSPSGGNAVVINP
jgi:hypothetical protein